MVSDTIAAISTPPGKGGVAIIRLSGENPLSVAQKMFFPSGKRAVSDFEPQRMYPGEIDGGTFRDYGLCVILRLRTVLRERTSWNFIATAERA